MHSCSTCTISPASLPQPHHPAASPAHLHNGALAHDGCGRRQRFSHQHVGGPHPPRGQPLLVGRQAQHLQRGQVHHRGDCGRGRAGQPSQQGGGQLGWCAPAAGGASSWKGTQRGAPRCSSSRHEVGTECMQPVQPPLTAVALGAGGALAQQRCGCEGGQEGGAGAVHHQHRGACRGGSRRRRGTGKGRSSYACKGAWLPAMLFSHHIQQVSHSTKMQSLLEHTVARVVCMERYRPPTHRAWRAPTHPPAALPARWLQSQSRHAPGGRKRGRAARPARQPARRGAR